MHVCSPDQVPDVLVVARVSVFAGPRQLHRETGVLSAIERATSYLVQGRPFHFLGFVKTPSHFVLAALKDSTYDNQYASFFRLLRPRWKVF